MLLADYCQQKAMKFLYRKNAHKLKFEVPMSETKQLDFWIIFEKGRKKSTKGLYRLKFQIEKEKSEDAIMESKQLGSDQSRSNHTSEANEDYEFLCTGFLHLVKQFAEQSGNPIQSLVFDEYKDPIIPS